MLETISARIQRSTIIVLAVMLVVVVILSTAHLGVLIGEEIWHAPRFLIPVEGLLDIFGYFLLVLIGVELLETLRAYLKQDVIHVRVVLEVALIAMARKAIIQEPAAATGASLFGTAALILALAIAFYFERQTDRDSGKTSARSPRHSKHVVRELSAPPLLRCQIQPPFRSSPP